MTSKGQVPHYEIAQYVLNFAVECLVSILASSGMSRVLTLRPAVLIEGFVVPLSFSWEIPS